MENSCYKVRTKLLMPDGTYVKNNYINVVMISNEKQKID